MKKLFTCCMLTAALFSCKNSSVVIEPGAKAPIDSLVTNWSNSWSNHDSAAAGNLFTTDALLIDDNLIADNTGDIATKWIHPNINMVYHFKSIPLQSWSTSDRAGYTGRYSFDAMVKDSIVARPHGVYTLNWIKNEKGDWKITTADIHGVADKN